MNKRIVLFIARLLLAWGCFLFAGPASPTSAGWAIIGWNNLGMHCMDGDYSVFSILPPYNTVMAQVIDPAGKVVTDPARVSVTYQAVADPTGSINSSSRGKTNFWQFARDLYGADPGADNGLAGQSMPGPANAPQSMRCDRAQGWYYAEGIPITPYDDRARKNFYPMMHLTARDHSGAILAQTDVVLPVSDEMSCHNCHQSEGDPDATPSAGWAHDPEPGRDYRLNILRLHDGRFQADPVADWDRPPSGPLFLPQVVDGGGYSTGIAVLNATAVDSVAHIDFFGDDGGAAGFVFE